MIPYARQDVSEEDIRAVVAVLRSDWLTQGPEIERFERRVAEHCGAKFAVAVSSATAGLHLACRVLDLGTADTLWTSPNTFVASANCARYCGARVDFVDIDERTYNLSLAHLARKLQAAKPAGRLPKVVVPVHFAGQACEMEPLAALASEYGFQVIEDAAHAIGGSYRGAPLGSCSLSDLCVFSFHPVKIITTGEGGMILTNREELFRRLLRLRTHGITRLSAEMESESDEPWYYEQTELGHHYRMTDFQAALGSSQMNRLGAFVARRRALATRYDELLQDLPVVAPWQHPDAVSSFHLYVIQLRLAEIRKTHRQVFEELRHAGIGVNLHYMPVHLQPDYRRLGFKPGDFPAAEQYYRRAISLPMYPGLSERDQEAVVAALRAIIS